MRNVRLPAWQWAFTAFRFGDGLTWTVIPVLAVTHYGLPVWAPALVAAASNLASVPATVLWARAMKAGAGRRRLATFGFLIAAASMAVLALLPPFGLYVVAAAVFMFFGVATVAASNVLVMEAASPSSLGHAVGLLNRRTGMALVAGTLLVIFIGLGGVLDASALFVAVAFVSVASAGVAWFTISPGEADGSSGPAQPERFVEAALREGPGRGERLLSFPFSLRHRPRFGSMWRRLGRDEGPVLVATIGLLSGAVVILAAMPGILADEQALPVGYVLMAQAPSFVASAVAYGWAGSLGDARGRKQTLRIGAVVRAAAVPAMCAALLLGGAFGYGALLIANAALGVGFALLFVNGPLLVADMTAGSRNRAVGAFHAAVAVGLLTGSLLSVALLLTAPIWAAYVVAIGLTWASAALLVPRLLPALRRRVPARA